MMKYKAGDKVRIREDLESWKAYGFLRFVPKMRAFCGRIARITEVNNDGVYRIDLSPHCFHWTDEMFEDVDMEEQKMDKHVGIYVNGNKVIAVNLKTGKEGVARCHPDDDFDFYIGAKIALERLEEAEKPYGWLKKGMQYYTSDITAENLCEPQIYGADRWDKSYMERGIAFKTKEEAIECAKRMLAVVKQEVGNER